MSEKVITVSILGTGARGGEAYGQYMFALKERYKIVAICDINPLKLQRFRKAFALSDAQCFLSENDFFACKRSDLVVIATPDRLHVCMAKRALALGYHVLLEKPISDNPSELRELMQAAEQAERQVIVCHVLRYTVMIRKLKEILDSGVIGKLVSIDQTENVVYWHEAHSYVRGNWRKWEETTPMIMAKCCHDLDLLQYFAGSRCETVSSMGSLAYFTQENMPQGAAARCMDCKYQDTCTYSAKTIYLQGWKNRGCRGDDFPVTVITDEFPLTEEVIVKALRQGPYGRCVFACDNDVVDNQTTIMQFENGITATLKMEAFVKYGGRDIRFFGTDGELILNEAEDTITLKIFNGKDTVWRIGQLSDEYGGQGAGLHGGGDHRLIDKLYDILTNKTVNADTLLVNSVESHYMAIAAEESRLLGGETVALQRYRK